MPRRSLRCVVEINVHALTCPGVYLPRRDDVYLSVCLFGQVRRTQLSSAIFPLIFHERFKFDKVFYTAYTPRHVADSLEDEPVIIELIQLSDVYEGGKLLASYESSGRDFLYPYPSYTPTYGTQDRDILMERSLDFPGISPRLEFSTQTIISELHSTVLTPSDIDDEIVYVPKSGRRSRSRTRSPSKKNNSISYGRPTVSSITRSRSLSPSLRRRFDALNIDEDTTADRPPFVVRKVQSRKLTGRDPGTRSPKQNIQCMHGTYSDANTRKVRKTPRYTSTAYALDLYTDNLRPKYSQVYRSSDEDYDYDTASDLLDLTTSPRRYRSPSPVLYSPSLSARYLDRSYSPMRSEVISAQVDRAIEKNRVTRARLDRLDSLYPYSSYRYQRDIDALDDLELELELSRRRRYTQTYY